jgi:hypothetical protein
VDNFGMGVINILLGAKMSWKHSTDSVGRNSGLRGFTKKRKKLQEISTETFDKLLVLHLRILQPPCAHSPHPPAFAPPPLTFVMPLLIPYPLQISRAGGPGPGPDPGRAAVRLPPSTAAATRAAVLAPTSCPEPSMPAPPGTRLTTPLPTLEAVPRCALPICRWARPGTRPGPGPAGPGPPAARAGPGPGPARAYPSQSTPHAAARAGIAAPPPLPHAGAPIGAPATVLPGGGWWAGGARAW